MSVFSWLTRPFSLKDSGTWLKAFGFSSHSGKSVTPTSAMQLSAAWACVNVVASTWATLPLHLFERVGDDGRKIVRDHPLADVFENPNADQTSAEFWEGAGACAMLRGVFFARKLRRSSGDLIGLETMHPDSTTMTREGGEVVFRWRDPDGKLVTLKEDDVFYMIPFGGRSPIDYARHSLGTALAADESAGKIFANGLLGSGFLQTDQELKTPQRDQLHKIMGDFVGSKNAGKMMILEAGMKYAPLSFNPEEAQLLQTRQFQIEEICRWFGVPPVLIGHASAGQTMWGSGVEQIFLGWLILNLRPMLVKSEKAINKRLLRPAERRRFYSEHSIEGLLRADSAGRAALYSSFAQNGIMTRNEMRKRENLPPVDGGDALTVQSNLVPLDLLGNDPGGTQKTRAALRELLGLTEAEK